jgi:hypothetical protein
MQDAYVLSAFCREIPFQVDFTEQKYLLPLKAMEWGLNAPSLKG